jgi:hypothetical protein
MIRRTAPVRLEVKARINFEQESGRLSFRVDGVYYFANIAR